MTRAKSTIYVLLACFIGGLTAYLADWSYWQASTISVVAYGLIMLIDRALTTPAAEKSDRP